MLRRTIVPLLSMLVMTGCLAESDTPASLAEDSDETRALFGPEEALGILAKSLAAHFDSQMALLEKVERAKIANAMAWADEHPLELRVNRGRRHTVTHVSARFLAHDDLPKADPGPTDERAQALFKADGIGSALMALGPDESVELQHQVPLPNDAVKFVYEHRFAGLPVYAGEVVVTLDKAGRLTSFAAGPAASIDPTNQLTVSEKDAVANAIKDLEDRKDPIWTGLQIELGKVTQMIANVEPWIGVDEDRFVWRVELSGGDGQLGTREVVVDGSTGKVLTSIEHTSLLDHPDTVQRYSGVIGDEPYTPVGEKWFGDDRYNPMDGSAPWETGCASATDSPSGSTALERDWDETKAALCETSSMFGDDDYLWRQWFDPSGGEGVHVGIGLTPFLSGGVNNHRGGIFLAEGVGRAEIVGHELFHSAFVPENRITSFRASKESKGIIEHMCDVFGVLLERRFDHRVEGGVCSMNNDPDSMAAAASINLDPESTTIAYRWCSDEMIERPWRNTCEPMQINSGWCEGAARYADLGANVYDIYGETSGPNNYVASHTNLGIGNRIYMALLGEESAGFLPGRSIAMGDDSALELLLNTARTLMGSVDWASYGETMLAAARDMDVGVAPGSIERQLRSYLAAARVWTPPAEVRAEVVVDPTHESQVAAASTFVRVLGSPGVERTYVFYRPESSSDTVEYVWRDDPAGGSLAAATATWQGPCNLPGVETKHAVAATGREDGGIWVAWNDAISVGATGTLRVTGLAPGGEATSVDKCGDSWAEVPAAQPRSMIGAPAIADWVSASDRTLCEIVEADFPELELPFRAWGSSGFQAGNCVDIGERIPPWILKIIPDSVPKFIIDQLFWRLDKGPGAGIPAPFDPHNPNIVSGRVEHRIPLVTMLDDPDFEAELAKLEVVGPRFAEAFATHGAADARTAELLFGWKIGLDGDPKTGLPSGQIETIELRFANAQLIVAFRDPDGALRVVPFTDPRPTAEIPLLEANPVADPALATASQRVQDPDTGLFAELEFLYVVYGTEEDDGEGPVPNRLNFRFTGFLDQPGDPEAFSEAIFAPAERLDMIKDEAGLRRRVDYRTLRTLRTPVIAGTRGALDVFVVSLTAPSHEPSDGPLEEAYTRGNRIRHVSLDVAIDGTLKWDSERPVLLTNTELSESTPGQAGGAMYTQRNILRWFYPNGTQLSVRSRH